MAETPSDAKRPHAFWKPRLNHSLAPNPHSGKRGNEHVVLGGSTSHPQEMWQFPRVSFPARLSVKKRWSWKCRKKSQSGSTGKPKSGCTGKSPEWKCREAPGVEVLDHPKNTHTGVHLQRAMRSQVVVFFVFPTLPLEFPEKSAFSREKLAKKGWEKLAFPTRVDYNQEKDWKFACKMGGNANRKPPAPHCSGIADSRLIVLTFPRNPPLATSPWKTPPVPFAKSRLSTELIA